MNITIQAVQFTADKQLLDFIHKKIEKLSQFFDRITSVDVYLKLDNQSSQIKDKVVSLRCNIPGNQLFAEETSKKFEEGIDQAILALKRQLKKHKEKLRK